MIRSVGKAMRLKRVIDREGVSIICALDHGMTSPTFLEPLADITTRTSETVKGGANVIMMSKGMIRVAEPAFAPTTSLALLLSGFGQPAVKAIWWRKSATVALRLQAALNLGGL